MSDIVVVGSLNRDTVVRVERIPSVGETVIGRGLSRHRGGKGANQALAAARLGRDVAMIGRVGADAEGTAYLRALVAEGVNVDAVSVDIDAPTGRAFILLGDDAENVIAIVPGANGHVSGEDVAAASSLLDRAAVVVAQLEVPLDAVKAAAGLARGTFVLNPAPAMSLGHELLALVDVLVPNRSELAALTGTREATKIPDVIAQAKRIRGPAAVIVTLGEDGAVVVTAETQQHVPAPQVTPVDTTGAGDAFCAALADALARGEQLIDAVAWGTATGAVATTKLGAQTALPTVAEVRELVGR